MSIQSITAGVGLARAADVTGQFAHKTAISVGRSGTSMGISTLAIKTTDDVAVVNGAKGKANEIIAHLVEIGDRTLGGMLAQRGIKKIKISGVNQPSFAITQGNKLQEITIA